MSASSPAPSSADDTERCYSFTLIWENQGQLPVCLKPEDWEVIFEAAAIGIAASLLLGFLVAATRHKLWHHSGTLKCFLDFVSDTLYCWLGHFAILVQALYANNSIIWTVLLFATYGCFYSVVGYSLYGHGKKKAILTHEKKQLANSSFVLVLLLLVTDYGSEISRILFVIWGLSMLKIIGRICSFRAAEKSYGTANTKLVALYMKHQHRQGAPFDPSKMEGYKYLVIGEEQQVKPEPPSYEPKLSNYAAVTTIEDVWRCDGRLFKGSSGGGRYRDMCLSFALFKLIKMRFDGYPQVEDIRKSCALVRDGLLSEDDDGKRAFEVVKSELGFLRDLFHTKHPVASNPWILICNFVLFATIAMALWIAMTIDRKTNAEHPITKVLVCLLILAEMWEFISYLFSDWGKVILICKYVKNYRALDRYHVDKILRVILWQNLSGRSLYEKLEQFSLLNSLNSRCTCCSCCSLLVLYRLPGTSRKLTKKVRKEKPTRLKAEVKKAIFVSLRKLLASERVVLTNGITTLAELGHDDQLGWACGVGDHARADEHTHMHTIMIWHIATALCEMELPPKKEKGDGGLRSDQLESRAAVANTLSKYCAYLVVFAPEFLPINRHSSKIMFKQMFAEAYEACPPRGICRKITYGDVVNIEDSDPTIISKGVKLGRQLMNHAKEDAERWELLERFWAELILFLAPSEDAMAHARKLEEGGEFITHLWALLYHARVEERSPEKNEHAGEHV